VEDQEHAVRARLSQPWDACVSGVLAHTKQWTEDDSVNFEQTISSKRIRNSTAVAKG
jgi:hypothetical protein